MSEYVSEVMGADRSPGAISILADQLERLHHQIGLLEDHLSPVLRGLAPEKAVEAVPESPRTQIEVGVGSAAEAVERIIRLRDRLVI